MMGQKYTDWPTGGPDKWLMNWQDLMGKCAKWYPQATDQLAWIHDFNLVWGMVLDAHDVCN